MVMEFQPVILAAGHGSRMMDLTSKTPKALLPVGNMPLVWYPVQMLEKAGFDEAIVIVLESTKAAIQKALVNICNVRLQLDFVSIPDSADWGTADSLRHIADKIKTDVLVISCDLITDLSFHLLADVHRIHNAAVTMLFAPAPELSDTSVPGGKSNKKTERDLVGLDPGVSKVLFLSSEADVEESVTFRKSLLKRHPRIHMRSKLLDGHLYLMKKAVIDYLVQNKNISTVKGELLPHLVRNQFRTGTVQQSETDSPGPSTSTHIHSKPDLRSLMVEDQLSEMAKEYSSYTDSSRSLQDTSPAQSWGCYAYMMQEGFCLRANTITMYCEANRQIPKRLNLLPSDTKMVDLTVTREGKSQIGGDSMVGEGGTIKEKASIKRSVIGKHCQLGEKTKVTNCVVMDHVIIQEGSNLQGCIICENVHIGEKCELKDCVVGNSQHVNALGKFTGEVLVDRDRMMEI